MRWCGGWLAIVSASVAIAAPQAPKSDLDVRNIRASLDADYAAKLDALANWCEESGLSGEADFVRRWRPTPEPGAIRLFLPEDTATRGEKGGGDGASAGDTEIDSDESAASAAKRREHTERFAKLRADQAAARYELARQAAKCGHGTLVMELVNEAARENPSLADARRMLGDVAVREGVWLSAFAARQQMAGKRWHPQFGWLLADHVAKYEGGQRYYPARWIPAAREAELRRDIARGWQIENEHFTLTTNVSLEAGVELSARLERFYRVWDQLFIRFCAPEETLTKWLDHRAVRRDAPKHKVIYFADREQYVAALRPKQPLIDGTLGIYFDRDRRSYFYAGKETDDAAVVYHEATHQLFQEMRRAKEEVGSRGNFWIVEGIACYLESLEIRDGCAYLGSPRAGRLPAARQRALKDDFYVPLSMLVRWTATDIQRHPDIAKIYSQSAGLATFLMQGKAGAYREALMAYLEAVYAGRADERTLARLTAASYEQLDAEYRAFLAETSAP